MKLLINSREEPCCHCETNTFQKILKRSYLPLCENCSEALEQALNILTSITAHDLARIAGWNELESMKREVTK